MYSEHIVRKMPIYSSFTSLASEIWLFSPASRLLMCWRSLFEMLSRLLACCNSSRARFSLRFCRRTKTTPPRASSMKQPIDTTKMLYMASIRCRRTW